MARKHERTLQMKEEFCELRAKGISISDIAKKYDLSLGTVYRSLDDIARANGCTRESLLTTPHSLPVTYERQFEPVPEIDLTNFEERFDQTIAGFDSVRDEVKKSIKEQEETICRVEKEQKTW